MPDGEESQLPNHITAKVYRRQELVFRTVVDGRVEFGRQRQDEPPPIFEAPTAEGARVVIESLTETKVSRKHFVMEPLGDGRIAITNASSQVPIVVQTNLNLAQNNPAAAGANSRISDSLPPGGQCELAPPFLLSLGPTTIRFECETVDQGKVIGLDTVTIAPGRSIGGLTDFRHLFRPGETVNQQQLLDWLGRAMSVFQESATSSEFLPQAAQATIDTVGLDVAAILTRDAEQWKIETVVSRSAEDESSWRPSKTILNRVLAERRTFRQIPDWDDESPESLVSVAALVAAPILDANGEVIGALYGDRRQRPQSHGLVDVTELEARLVEVFASAVAAGLARLEQEQLALASRVRFEQFFTPELSRELEAHEDLLEGRDAEVSLLFGDIGGFSRISERMGPRATVEWINSVLDTLSQCVADQAGVLVDYVGDELFAMWGAPQTSADHAIRACRTALQMQSCIAQIDDQWLARTGEPFSFGVGINTGVARVGNVGSQLKFKYGPLGNAVNLASRVQGATKHLRAQTLITGATATGIDRDEFAIRRLCRIKVVNIQEPVEVYELSSDNSPAWQALRDQYEAALAAFESTDLAAAAKLLGESSTEHPDDGPSKLLLSRVAGLLAKGEATFDPVWELPGK